MIVVSHPETKFFLNHSTLTLAEKVIKSNCTEGTGWDISVTPNRCVEGIVEICSNGATNYPLCTTTEDTCLNGANNPPDCTNGGDGNGDGNGFDDGTNGICTYGEWSSCSAVDCSESGVRTRARDCTLTGAGTDTTVCFATGCKVDGDKDGNQWSVTLTATPSKIFKGRASLLTWDSNANNCYSMPEYGEFNTGGKRKSDPANPVYVSPTTSTNYGIICTKNGVTDTDYATVTVNGIKIKER